MDARGLRNVGRGAKAAGKAAEVTAAPVRYTDPLALVGRNAEGTYPTIDYGQIVNAARSSKGIDGHTVIGALDVDEFRRARYGDQKTSDIWDNDAVEEFKNRAAARLEGREVVPENLPRLKALVDPDTGNIRINLTDDWDEVWETAATYADASRAVGRRVPFELEFDRNLRESLNNRPLSGFVEIVDDDHGGVLAKLPLNELDLPGISDIRSFVDVDLEARTYYENAANPEWFTDNRRSRRAQPRTDAQARAVVRSMYNSDAMFLMGVKPSDISIVNATIKAARDDLAKATGRNPKDIPITEVLEAKAFDAPKKEAREIIETQRELDDWMAEGRWETDKEGNQILKGGLFRHMEQRDPERYQALLNYVRETPWTRRNIYGDDVSHPDEPILFYHYSRDFRWNDGRQYLQEGEHAREMGRHAGSAEAANTFYGYTPIGPWPGEKRSVRSGQFASGRTAEFEDVSKRVDRHIKTWEKDLQNLGVSDEVLKKIRGVVFNAMESRWTSIPGRSRSVVGAASILKPELNTINEALGDIRAILGNAGIAPMDIPSGLQTRVEAVIQQGARVTGGMMTPHVVGAKRPFRMWDYGEFDSRTVLRAISEAHFGDLETTLKVQIQDVLNGNIRSTDAERNQFAQMILERLGFDSILYNNTHEAGPVPSIIVWRPELIKPITESKAFDKADPRRAAAFMPWWAGMFGEEEDKEGGT